MGQKGTGVNVRRITSTFMLLTQFIETINRECSVIQTAKIHILEGVSNASVDAATKEQVESVLSNISDTMNGVQEQTAAIKKQVDKLLAAATEIQSRSKAASATTIDKTAGVKNKFAKR